MISGVAKVGIATEDQARAREFWVEKMGFEVVTDLPYHDDFKWLELTPPDHSLLLVIGSRQAQTGDVSDIPDVLPTSNVWFACDDLHKTYAELTARGVEFSQEPKEFPFGWWSVFKDPDGNRYALVPRG